MPRPVYRQRWAWIGGMHSAPNKAIPDVESADFALSSLADRGLMTTRQLADFQEKTGLADLAWSMSWNSAALAEADGDLRALLRRTQGFVIFLHGWGGMGNVWQHLATLTCAANPRLIALTPDLNGFGQSPFLAEVPAVEQCDSYALMGGVVLWVKILGLRSNERAQKRRKVITLVGHSMGGAALFCLEEQAWQKNEYARCAVAPTLLMNDELRQGFYGALGVESWASQPIDDLKVRLTPRVVENLLGAVEEATLHEHLHVFNKTPRGTLAQTFYAMGAAWSEPQAKEWHNFRVVLAHDDRVLNVTQMLHLLDDMGLGPNQIQVVAGDHYLFSMSDDKRPIRWRNREIILGEILYLHERCREQQRSSSDEE